MVDMDMKAPMEHMELILGVDYADDVEMAYQGGNWATLP
jgi:hypothetical protein